MSIDPSMRVDNSLLAALPRGDWRRLVGHCKPVNLVFGDILCEAGDRFGHVHFPLSGFISLVATLDAQQPLEMGLIGSEGMLGATLMLGVDTAPMRAVVQGPGSALRISRADFRRELEASSALRKQLARYLYVLMSQLAKSAACTHFHETAPRWNAPRARATRRSVPTMRACSDPGARAVRSALARDSGVLHAFASRAR